MKLKILFRTFALLTIPFYVYAITPNVGALDPLNRVCNNNKAASSEFCKDSNDAQSDTANNNAVIRTIRAAANIVALITGLLAVIMIMVGGFTYITSGGSSDKVTTARNRILYSVIGLIIVVSAWAIVRFITDRIIQ